MFPDQDMDNGGKGFLNLKGNQEEHIHWLKQSLSCEKIKREQTKQIHVQI